MLLPKMLQPVRQLPAGREVIALLQDSWICPSCLTAPAPSLHAHRTTHTLSHAHIHTLTTAHAHALAQARPNSNLVFLPSEITSAAYYMGAEKNRMVANCIFRWEGMEQSGEA